MLKKGRRYRGNVEACGLIMVLLSHCNLMDALSGVSLNLYIHISLRFTTHHATHSLPLSYGHNVPRRHH